MFRIMHAGVQIVQGMHHAKNQQMNNVLSEYRDAKRETEGRGNKPVMHHAVAVTKI